MAKSRIVTEGHRRIVLKTGETKRSDGMYLFYYYDSDHKRRSISSSTVNGLREKEAKLNLNKVNNIRTDKQRITLNEVHNEWLTTISVNPHTKSNYDWLYDSYVKGGFGKKAINSITAGDVVRFYKGLITEKNLAVTTVDGLQTVVQQVFIYAVKSHYISENVCSGVMKNLKKVYGKKKEVQAFSLEEQKRFLSYLQQYDVSHESHWYPVFSTMIMTGLRVGELTGLQWSDVELKEHGRLYVRHNLVFYKDENSKTMIWRMNDPKTNAGNRDFELTKEAIDSLIIQKNLNLKSSANIDGYTDFIFVNRFGKVQHQGTLNRALSRIITEANIDALEKNDKGANIVLLPSLSTHALRKSFITRCAESDVSIKVCAKMVGHSDYRITMDIYTKVGKEWESNELDKLEKHLNN